MAKKGLNKVFAVINQIESQDIGGLFSLKVTNNYIIQKKVCF